MKFPRNFHGILLESIIPPKDVKEFKKMKECHGNFPDDPWFPKGFQGFQRKPKDFHGKSTESNDSLRIPKEHQGNPRTFPENLWFSWGFPRISKKIKGCFLAISRIHDFRSSRFVKIHDPEGFKANSKARKINSTGEFWNSYEFH